MPPSADASLANVRDLTRKSLSERSEPHSTATRQVFRASRGVAG